MPRPGHSWEFKAKPGSEAFHGERTIHELAAEYGVHPILITQWKQIALEGLPQ
jgi:transposase-like protein